MVNVGEGEGREGETLAENFQMYVAVEVGGVQHGVIIGGESSLTKKKKKMEGRNFRKLEVGWTLG